MVTSTFMTSLLWVGGSGHSKYVPILGSRPTDYQNSQNRLMFETFTQKPLRERVIQKVKVDGIKTGDVLISRRWTGYAAEIMLLSGS